MKKRILSILLTVGMLLSLVPMLGITTAADVDLSASSIVLSDGQAYENSTSGTNITGQVAAMGLSYDSGTDEWTMDNFVFSTTARDAVHIEGQTAVNITVTGDNTITAGNSQLESDGLYVKTATHIGGTGSLTVTAGNSENGGSYGIAVDSVNFTVSGITLTATGGTSDWSVSEGMNVDNGSFAVTDATVNLNGGYAISSYGLSINSGSSVAVTGTGKITATATSGSGSVVAVDTECDLQLTATDIAGNPLTWSSTCYLDSNGNVPSAAVLTEAASSAADYTIVLSDGKAYANATSGAEITAEVADMGLTYAEGVWTMNNFNFTTTAGTAMKIVDTATTITVTGSNSLTGTYTDASVTRGLNIKVNTKLQGTGTLSVTSGNTAGYNTYGMAITSEDVDFVVDGITLTVKGGDGTVNVDSYGYYSEDENVTITVNNAEVTFIGGAVSDSYGGRDSCGMYGSGTVTVTGTGKLTAMGTTATGEGCRIIGLTGLTSSEVQATVKDGAGAPLTVNDNTVNVEDAAGNIAPTAVLTAKVDTPDYTIFLCSDKARKNGDAGDDITADVAAMGLTYAEGVWTMNNFNFTTTAGTALKVVTEVTVTVTGSNSITGGDKSDSYGLVVSDYDDACLTLQGTGSLTVTAGNATGSEGYSSGICAAGNLTVQGITLTAKSGNAFEARGLENVGTFTVADATVNLTAGNATGADSVSVGLSNWETNSTVVVTGTGKITATAGTTGDTVVAISGGSDPQMTVVDGNGNALTWDTTDATYKNGAGEAATTVVLTAAGSPKTAITVTAGSATKMYDSTPLTNDTAAVTSGSLKQGDTLSATVTGTITDAGQADNVISSCKIMRGTEDVTSEYNISLVKGTLTVNKSNELKLVDLNGDEYGTRTFNFTYDGQGHESDKLKTNKFTSSVDYQYSTDGGNTWSTYNSGYVYWLSSTPSEDVVLIKYEDSNYEPAYATINFTLVAADIGDTVRFTLSDIAAQTYTGAALEPALTVHDATTGSDMVKGTDYTLSYKDSNGVPVEAADLKTVGTYSVTVTGMGNYKGTRETSFTINAAGSPAADYAIVIYGDKAYRTMALYGDDITADVAAMGLSYADGVWTMNNFNFTTTAVVALAFTGDTPFTVEVVGNNSVTSGTSAYDSTYGMRIDAETTLQGSGTLTVNDGGTSGIRTAYGLSAKKNVEVKDITLTINGGDAAESDSVALALFSESGATFTVNNATVVCNGGDADEGSTGIYNAGFTIVVTGTGTLTAKAGVGQSGGSAISGGSDPQMTVVDGDGNALTWDSGDETYKNEAGEAATTLVMTKAGPEITDGAEQVINVSTATSASFTSNAPANTFVKVVVNGEDLDAQNYILDVGTVNTVITLLDTYLSTLENGEYTLSIVSDSGSADTTFTVEGYAPPTADYGIITLCTVVFVASALALAYINRKKIFG